MVKEICIVSSIDQKQKDLCKNFDRKSEKCLDIQSDPVTKEELEKQIIAISKDLYKYNKHLFEIEVHEQCVAALFWHYFLNKYSEQYKGYDIDIEYSKAGENVKRIDDSKKYVRPDLIIHKRNCNKYNFAWIEFKTLWNNSDKRMNLDYDKLKKATSTKCKIKYKYGISVVLDKNPTLKWFTDGKEYKAQNESNDEKL